MSHKFLSLFEDPEQPDPDLYITLPQSELEDDEPGPLQIPAAQFIVQHTVAQTVDPILLFEMPFMVREIAQMLQLRWGFGHLALPLLFPVFLSEDVARSFGCRPYNLFIGFIGKDTFEFWAQWSQFETVVVYPGLQETLFFQNDGPITLDCWTASEVLYENLLAMLPLVPPTTAPLVPSDASQNHQTVAAPSPHIIPYEPNFEQIDPKDPRFAAVIGDPTVPARVIHTKKVYGCTVSNCTHKSSTVSNRRAHEKTHEPPGFNCHETICARKSQDERERSGTGCLLECERYPCGGLVCPKVYTQKWSLERHISEDHTLVPLLGCPAESCEMRAKRHGVKCEEHGDKVKRLKTST